MAKVLLLLLLGGSFVFGFASAVEVPEGCEDPGPRPEETTVSSWQVEGTSYQCQNNQCGGTVKQRTVEAEEETRTFHTLEEDENHCPTWEQHIVTTSTGATRNSITDISLGKYQACPESANNQWVSSFPGQCSGKCYPEPRVRPLNDAALSPKNVFDSRGKPKLPLNVGWEDNVEQEVAASSCAVDTYTYAMGSTTGETQEQQVVPGSNECALLPNTSYDFSVKACANDTCSKASEKLSFTTSDAIQLVSPYDPDWEGKQGGIAPLPVTLQWCPHPKANSYKIQAYRVNAQTQERGNLVLSFGTEKTVTQYIDSFLNTFLRGDPSQPLASLYEWEISPCTDLNQKTCGIESQAWRVLPGGELAKPNLRTPSNNAAVNMQDSLSWDFVQFASRYVVRLLDISENGTGARDIFVPGNPKLSFQELFKFLRLNTSYSWMVAPCGGDPESKQLSSCESWSEERIFTTTGAVPTDLKVAPVQDGRAALPITFNWNDAPGAASYNLRIGGEQSLNVRRGIKNSQIVIDYPALVPSSAQDYPWQVRTCADSQGLVCGDWSSLQFFKTASLKAPTLLKPLAAQTEFFATTEFAWTKDFASNFFTYKLKFLKPSTEEKSSSCQTPPTHPVAEGLLEENDASIRLRCLGEYEFRIQACVDKACEAFGPETTQKLTIEKFVGKAGGFIPCDANNDNPATIGLDERETCELKHLFLLVRNLVDFALWKLSLIILIAMTAFTGFTMYTSFGGMEVMAKARSIWKAVGIGFLILLFSWLLLNLFLGLAGFQVNIFGKWHELVI